MIDQAELLKAEAIAARRAARAPWQNAHVDRINREREARRISKEFRQAEREAEGAARKSCSACGQSLPLDSFSPAFRDRPTARCKACVAAATRDRYHRDLDKARSRTRNRPARTERPLRASERPRRTTEEREQRAAERQRIANERARKQAERHREAAERVTQLTALLMGTSPGQRITTEQGWDVAASELRRLWLESGDKVCIQCKAVVPPSAMLPPGPANFYPGKCRSCASAESRAHSERVFGPYIGPRPILLRDGSTITLAEFARRHRERELGRPCNPIGAYHHDTQPTLCALG
jgi:hypothetical protein